MNRRRIILVFCSLSPLIVSEVRIFDRALSAPEVAGLAGRTEPFDKP